VNERKRSISGSGKRSVVGLDLVPHATGPRRSRERSIASACGDSIVVFCGDAQQVSDGFAMALNAMVANADLWTMGTEPVPERD
jgi:hypothetical protein